MPGWYADPAGAPGRFRYWDGQAWSATTTTNTGDPAPPSGAPGPGRPRRPRRGRLITAGVLALVIIIAAVFGVNAVLDQRSKIIDYGPATSQPGGDDSSGPAPRPTPTDVVPSGATVTVGPPSSPPSTDAPPTAVDCPVGEPMARQPPVAGNRIHGGNLSFAPQSNYVTDPPLPALSWAYDVGSQSRPVQATWLSTFAVGALSTIDGFEEPKTAAQLVLACTAPSPLYDGFTGRKVLSAKALKVDGHPAWAIRAEIHVDTPKTTLPGDVVEVIVVDADSPESLSMFWACVPIGDQAALSQLDGVVKSLRVS